MCSSVGGGVGRWRAEEGEGVRGPVADRAGEGKARRVKRGQAEVSAKWSALAGGKSTEEGDE